MNIRPMELSDMEMVRTVHERNGLGTFDAALWRWQCEEYPFANLFSGVPIGWVLESPTAGIVGAISNVRMLYEINGDRIRAAITSAWGVDTAHRAYSLKLIQASRHQPFIDLWLDTSANRTASRILGALKIPRVPVPEYTAPMFFVVDRRAFAKAALQRRRWPIAAFLSWPASLVMLARDAGRRNVFSRSAGSIDHVRAFDDRFDVFWDRVRRSKPRLRAVRSKATLAWRFWPFLRKGEADILVVSEGRDICGYTVLVKRSNEESGLHLYDIADLQVIADNPKIIQDLLLGAIELTAAKRGHAVKWLCGQRSIREIAFQLNPYTYSVDHWPLYYYSKLSYLNNQLLEPLQWDIGYFDTF